MLYFAKPMGSHRGRATQSLVKITGETFRSTFPTANKHLKKHPYWLFVMFPVNEFLAQIRVIIQL